MCDLLAEYPAGINSIGPGCAGLVFSKCDAGELAALKARFAREDGLGAVPFLRAFSVGNCETGVELFEETCWVRGPGSRFFVAGSDIAQRYQNGFDADAPDQSLDLIAASFESEHVALPDATLDFAAVTAHVDFINAFQYQERLSDDVEKALQRQWETHVGEPIHLVGSSSNLWALRLQHALQARRKLSFQLDLEEHSFLGLLLKLEPADRKAGYIAGAQDEQVNVAGSPSPNPTQVDATPRFSRRWCQKGQRAEAEGEGSNILKQGHAIHAAGIAAPRAGLENDADKNVLCNELYLKAGAYAPPSKTFRRLARTLRRSRRFDGLSEDVREKVRQSADAAAGRARGALDEGVSPTVSDAAADAAAEAIIAGRDAEEAAAAAKAAARAAQAALDVGLAPDAAEAAGRAAGGAVLGGTVDAAAAARAGAVAGDTAQRLLRAGKDLWTVEDASQAAGGVIAAGNVPAHRAEAVAMAVGESNGAERIGTCADMSPGKLARWFAADMQRNGLYPPRSGKLGACVFGEAACPFRRLKWSILTRSGL